MVQLGLNLILIGLIAFLVIAAGDVILFIDEVHTLIGSGTVGRGNKGSGLDLANLLKPPLGRGELQVMLFSGFSLILCLFLVQSCQRPLTL